MPQNLPLTNRLSQTPGRYKNRVRRAQFGDGYEQSVVDGINATLGEWDLAYENLDASEYGTVLAALGAVGSWDYLIWQSPMDGVPKRWKVKDEGVSITPKSGTLYDLSFSIRQVP
jgi:phage-related protein